MPSNRGSLFDPFIFFPRNACHDASVKYRTGRDCHNQLPEPWRKCTQPHGPTPWWKLSANQSVQRVSMLTAQRLHSTQPTVRIIAITRAIPDKQSYSKHSKLTSLLHHNIQVFLCSHCSSLKWNSLSVQNFKGHPWRQTKATLVGTQAETCVRKLVEPRITRWNSLWFQKKTFINNFKLLSSLRFHCNWETLHHACGTAFVTNTVSCYRRFPDGCKQPLQISQIPATHSEILRSFVSGGLLLVLSYTWKSKAIQLVFITPTMQILQI